MKRWQDRGEVEDSEGDEDLSLEPDSPSPERPHKRVKHSKEESVEERISDQLDVSDDDDEANWIQAKVATTYGRRGKVTKQTSAPSFCKGTPAKSVDNGLPGSTLDAGDRSGAGETGLQRNSRGPTPGNITDVTDPDHGLLARRQSAGADDITPVPLASSHPDSQTSAGHAHAMGDLTDLTPIAQRIVQPQFITSVLLKRTVQGQGPIIGAIEGEPEVPIASQSAGSTSALAISRNDDFARLSDLTSSPLSERDVSPPVHFPRQWTEASTHLRDDSGDLSEAESLPRESDLQDAHAVALAANERRSLRVRQEKQLHPYMYDKAQYQKQFRERGLKPVRVIEQPTPRDDTQSASQSAASQSSVSSHASSSPMSQSLRPPNTAPPQFSYFDAAGASSDNEPGFVHRLVKRRKIELTHQKRPGQLPTINSTARPMGRPTAFGQSSGPPSPPRTSSEIESPNMAARYSSDAVPGFRLPPGRGPGSLPTPQISSDARPRNLDLESPTGSPISMSKRDHRESDTLSSELSSSESETEVVAEAEATRLRREQKRIKGVLPASWLRIDFRKQRVQPSHSPAGRRRPSVEPSPISEPQKGVARKVLATKSRQDGSTGSQDIAHGVSDDSDDSLRELPAASRQSRLVFDNESLSIDPSEAAVDVDAMENDFVDPMLAGTSRTSKGNRGKQNQPRITDAFRISQGMREDLRHNRVLMEGGDRSISYLGSRPRYRRRKAHPRPSTAQLSILDAPRSPSTTATHLPQFIRLALRRARKEPSRGRHSPTGKVLRLATADETEEASSVLRAWRNGSIAVNRSQSPTRPDGQSSRQPVNIAGEDPIPLPSSPSNVNRPRIQATGLSRPTARTIRPRQGGRNRLRQMRIEPAATEERAMDQEPPDHLRNAKHSRRRQTLQQPRLRDAQLETLETEFDQMHRAAAFERRMQLLTENMALPERRSRASGFQLARFLDDGEDDTSHGDTFDAGAQGAAKVNPILPHRPRKSLARCLDTGTRQYRQPSEPIADFSIHELSLQADTSPSEPVLEGLGPFGTRYSADFDIEPLALGTFFQLTTLIGSGELSDAFNLAKRDLTCATGRMRVQLDGEMLEWGPWNEDVAANFARIPVAISEALQTLETTDVAVDRQQQLGTVDSNVEYLLRSVSRFCSKCLYFVDTVDRQSCADSLHRLVIDLGDTFVSAQSLPNITTKVLQYEMVIIKQASQISNHSIVSAATRSQIETRLLRASKRLADMAVLGHIDELRSFYEDNKHSEKRGPGIDGNALALSSIVMLNHARTASGSKSLLWPALCSAMGTAIDQTCAVGRFDKIWYDLFSLLPAMEIAVTGTVLLGSRLTQPQEDWTVPRAMFSRVFELYEASSNVRGYSVNDYVRALLSRCYSLVSKWGWWRCESVLNTIYDFFSRRGLALLKKEDGRGSPKFLDQLGSGLVELDVQQDDRSFHIFLKILASGLIGMSKYRLYGDRKIQGIAWRFIPNHNRTYRKDADVERSTLDALRNHHDLICTLYYASPPGHRPGVHLLRELVDHSTSHREACRLNVKAWANIASFQASTTESLEELRPLTSWFSDIMKTTVAQYRLAKSEAHQAFDQAKTDGANPSEALLESTVTNNQRQLASTVVDALAGLKRALNSTSSLPMAALLVEETSFWTVFELFDPSQRRLVGAMTEALQVVEIALNVQQRSTVTQESQLGSDDSQDFGDSDALQEFVANDNFTPESASIAEVLLGPVGHFMSNALGADVAPDDHLLQKAIDVWVRLAEVTVQYAKKTWLDYVNDYSATGWGQMRDTAQKRKFTTYFMYRVVEHATLHVEISHHVMTAWLLSLVEREALLKFQHVLTSALLKHFGHEPLLQNLPFARDKTGEFSITLGELRQRRLALISSLFCNMREIYERAGLGKSAEGIRMVYEGMLRQMMQAMKSNYQELQTTHMGAVAETSVQGAYVDFVQQVVSFLQQHTTSICKVDAFFTDSTVFPLPADDPTYVVGRLKGYVPHLHKPKSRKELATFVQSVGERAAVDGQQSYLVNQMATAMKGVADRGDGSSPSLRYLLMTTMFPAYIESAFTTACTWIQALPILQACEQVIPDLIYCVKIEDGDSLTAATDSVIAVLQSVNSQLKKTLDGFSGMLGFSPVLRTLSAMLLVGRSSLSLTSLIKRSTSHGEMLMNQVRALRELGIEIKGRLERTTEMSLYETAVVAEPLVSPWPDTRAYAESQLRGDMHLWHAVDGKYYLKKSGRTQEAVMPLRDSEQERNDLLRVIDDFCRAYYSIFSVRHCRGRRRSNVGENRWIDDVVI